MRGTTLSIHDFQFLLDVAVELNKARTKFSGNKHMLAALNEEVGEVANALLEHDFHDLPPEHVRKECVQVATMALRVAREGDASFKYTPDNFLSTALIKLNLDEGSSIDLIGKVLLERQKQDDQWGGPDHDDQHSIADWFSYIRYQMASYTKWTGQSIVTDQGFIGFAPPNKEAIEANAIHFESRMVKIIALAIAAVESNRRKNAAIAKAGDA